MGTPAAVLSEACCPWQLPLAGEASCTRNTVFGALQGRQPGWVAMGELQAHRKLQQKRNGRIVHATH